ncbi:MAG: hypothetical protein K2J85_03150 [Anaeroplasmataceae bacterium]|nr:hypothetical protein [Anaeroplasmataceae bacterium]
MDKAERKEMFKIVAETFKNLGFEVSKNKRVYVIEYPEVYVRIKVDAYGGISKLLYTVLFKKIHHPCDYFKEGNYDITGIYPSMNKCNNAMFDYFLEEIPFYKLADTIAQMVEKWILPFKQEPLKVLQKGIVMKSRSEGTWVKTFALYKDSALALGVPEMAAKITHSSLGFDNCIGYENLEGAFWEPKYIKDKEARQRVEERIKNQQKKD